MAACSHGDEAMSIALPEPTKQTAIGVPDKDHENFQWFIT